MVIVFYHTIVFFRFLFSLFQSSPNPSPRTFCRAHHPSPSSHADRPAKTGPKSGLKRAKASCWHQLKQARCWSPHDVLVISFRQLPYTNKGQLQFCSLPTDHARFPCSPCCLIFLPTSPPDLHTSKPAPSCILFLFGMPTCMDIVLLFSHAKAWAWLSPGCPLHARDMVFTRHHLGAVTTPVASNARPHCSHAKDVTEQDFMLISCSNPLQTSSNLLPQVTSACEPSVQ